MARDGLGASVRLFASRRDILSAGERILLATVRGATDLTACMSARGLADLIVRPQGVPHGCTAAKAYEDKGCVMLGVRTFSVRGYWRAILAGHLANGGVCTVNTG